MSSINQATHESRLVYYHGLKLRIPSMPNYKYRVIAADEDGAVHAFEGMPEFNDYRGAWVASSSLDSGPFDCWANYIAIDRNWKFSIVIIPPENFGCLDDMLHLLYSLNLLHEVKAIDDATFRDSSDIVIRKQRFPHDIEPSTIDYIINHSPYRFADMQIRMLKKKVQDSIAYEGGL